MSRAVEALGFRAKSWDVRHGNEHDLTNKTVVDRIISGKSNAKECSLA